MNPLSHDSNQSPQEVVSNAAGYPLTQLDEDERGRAAGGCQEVKSLLLGPDLGDVDVAEADGVSAQPVDRARKACLYVSL